MFVLCVVSKRHKGKIKTKNPVRMKYREQENTKKWPSGLRRGSSVAGIEGSNPAVCMDVCLL